jgi:DivIVA domain-containing protein
VLLERRALDDREFSVVRGGYDKAQVKAYLAELETTLCEFERWASETMDRLKHAEETARHRSAIEAAITAIYAAQNRRIGSIVPGIAPNPGSEVRGDLLGPHGVH